MRFLQGESSGGALLPPFLNDHRSDSETENCKRDGCVVGSEASEFDSSRSVSLSGDENLEESTKTPPQHFSQRASRSSQAKGGCSLGGLSGHVFVSTPPASPRDFSSSSLPSRSKSDATSASMPEVRLLLTPRGNSSSGERQASTPPSGRSPRVAFLPLGAPNCRLLPASSHVSPNGATPLSTSGGSNATSLACNIMENVSLNLSASSLNNAATTASTSSQQTSLSGVVPALNGVGSNVVSTGLLSPRLSSPRRVSGSLSSDSPLSSPRPSAAEVRREEEESERAFNERLHFLQQTGCLTPPSRETCTSEVSPFQQGSDGRKTEGVLKNAERKQGPSESLLPLTSDSLSLSYQCGKGLSRRTLENLDDWITQLLQCRPLKAQEIERLCNLLVQVLTTEDNCVSVASPVTVAGDIHGQFFDLLELFRVGGFPPDVRYVFMGDFVDRGFHSVEVFCLVACLKVKFPYSVFLLRGNHESRSITQVYGLYDECLRKYDNGVSVWASLTKAFDALPLAATIDGKTFCCHGGLSRDLPTINLIQQLDRHREPPPDGGMSEILWSDPYDRGGLEGMDGAEGYLEEAASDSLLDAEGWAPSSRGAGLLWGAAVTKRFLHTNGLDCICRAHQLVSEGFQWSDRHLTPLCLRQTETTRPLSPPRKN